MCFGVGPIFCLEKVNVLRNLNIKSMPSGKHLSNEERLNGHLNVDWRHISCLIFVCSFIFPKKKQNAEQMNWKCPNLGDSIYTH